MAMLYYSLVNYSLEEEEKFWVFFPFQHETPIMIK